MQPRPATASYGLRTPGALRRTREGWRGYSSATHPRCGRCPLLSTSLCILPLVSQSVCKGIFHSPEQVDHTLLEAEIVEDLESLLLQPQAETRSEAEAEAQTEAATEAAAQAEAQARTTATCNSSRLAAEATRVETQALEIMRVGYGGFDSYSE